METTGTDGIRDMSESPPSTRRRLRSLVWWAHKLVAVLALLVAGALVYLLWPEPRHGGFSACPMNLRNMNLALFEYVRGYDDEMPAADENIWLLLGPYQGDAGDKDAGGDHWRCPSDRFIPRRQREFWCSYAPNASVEETEEVIGCFSSNSKLSNKITEIAPITISFIEMWTPPEVVPGHPGFLLKLDRTKPENWRRSMVEPGKELCAIRSYRTARPVRFDGEGRLTDCGNYLFLRAFIGKRLEEMYHKGRMSVAFIDGHVETKWIKDVIAFDRPADNPDWTRARD